MLVKREPPQSFVGSIKIIEDDANDRRFKPTTGRIIAIGQPLRSEKTNIEIPWMVQVGDRILINRFAGHDCIIDSDDSFNIMDEADALAVFN